jgi:hypothetical protein
MGKFDHQLPLSGEIMDAPKALPGDREAGRTFDFVEAEFEEIGLPLQSIGEFPQAERRDVEDVRRTAGGMSMLKREADEKIRQRGTVLFYCAAVAVTFMAFWISGGYAVFPGMAQKAEQDNASLRIDNITTSSITVNQHPLLLVSGTVHNDGKDRAEPPPVKVTVTAKSGSIVSYQLGGKGWPLGPGQSMPFSSRLDAPASGVESVHVGLSGKGMD